MKFKERDIVKIISGTRFAYQSSLKGMIMCLTSSGRWYKVKFLDGYSNDFQDCDLELVEREKKEIKLYGIATFCKENYR